MNLTSFLIRNFICLVLALLIFCNCPLLAQSSFTLSGTTPRHFENAIVKIYRQNEADNLHARVKTNAFTLSGKLNQEYEKVTLEIHRGDSSLWTSTFYIQPGMMKVDIDSATSVKVPAARFTNIPFLEEQEEYQRTVVPVSDSAGETFRLLQYAKKVPTSGYDAGQLQAEYIRLSKEKKKQTIDFIKNHPSSYFALTIFDHWVMSRPLTTDSLAALFQLFNPAVRNTVLGMETSTQLDIRKSLSIDRKMPDFEFLSADKKPYSLAELNRSGFVLIGFWAPGCAPCIAHIPFMRDIAKKYGDRGLKLLWVCNDSSEEWWRKRLDGLNMPWLQTCDIEAYRGKISLDSLYNILYFPQYFLIDREGKLVYHNVQLQDDEEHSVLNGILQERFGD